MNTNFLAKLMRTVESESVDGAELLKNPKDNPICSLSYDDDARCVTVVWRKYATSAQLRFTHEVIIEMLMQYRTGKILGDDTDLPVVHAEDQRWIIEDWLPRAKAAGLKVAASSLSLAFFGKLSIASIQTRLAKEIMIKVFPNIHLARVWLRNLPG
jgi:hypothetical protein